MLLRSIAIEEIMRQRPPKFTTAISGFGIFEVEAELAANLCKAMIVAWVMTKFLLDCCKERRVRNYFHMANLGAEMPTVY
jgi:hypothetical protein